MSSQQSARRKKIHVALRYVEDYIEWQLRQRSRLERLFAEVEIVEEKEGLVVLKVKEGTIKVKEKVEPPAKLHLLGEARATGPPMLPLHSLQLQSPIEARERLEPIETISIILSDSIRAWFTEARGIEHVGLPWPSLLLVRAFSAVDITLPPIHTQSRVQAATKERPLTLAALRAPLSSVSSVTAETRFPSVEGLRIYVSREVRVAVAPRLAQRALATRLKGTCFLDLLIPEEGEKLRRLASLSGTYAGEPVFIVLPKRMMNLWYSVWVACREIYREVRGRYPKPSIFLEAEVAEMWRRWLEYEGELAGSVLAVRDELLERVVKEPALEKALGKRLKESFSQGLGFMILLAEEAKMDSIANDIASKCKPHGPLLLKLKVATDDRVIARRLQKVLEAIFGLRLEPVLLVDELVTHADRNYRNFIEEMLASNYMRHVRRDVGEKESEDHVAMKALAIKYLHEKERVELGDIECTKCLRDEGEKVVADVYVKERKLAVECETMLGQAPAPLLHIFESVRKYAEVEEVEEIWVVVRNWSAALHLGDLYWAERCLREELGKKIRFYVPDVRAKILKPLDEVIGQLKAVDRQIPS